MHSRRHLAVSGCRKEHDKSMPAHLRKQFSMRDLLWFMACVALAISWGTDRYGYMARREAMLQRLKDDLVARRSMVAVRQKEIAARMEASRIELERILERRRRLEQQSAPGQAR
jgi:hypothetical protein